MKLPSQDLKVVREDSGGSTFQPKSEVIRELLRSQRNSRKNRVSGADEEMKPQLRVVISMGVLGAHVRIRLAPHGTLHPLPGAGWFLTQPGHPLHLFPPSGTVTREDQSPQFGDFNTDAVPYVKPLPEGRGFTGRVLRKNNKAGKACDCIFCHLSGTRLRIQLA